MLMYRFGLKSTFGDRNSKFSKKKDFYMEDRIV
jgi:hypothetical protein